MVVMFEMSFTVLKRITNGLVNTLHCNYHTLGWGSVYTLCVYVLVHLHYLRKRTVFQLPLHIQALLYKSSSRAHLKRVRARVRWDHTWYYTWYHTFKTF